MSIEIKFTGETIPSIMGQMTAFIRGIQADTTSPGIGAPPAVRVELPPSLTKPPKKAPQQAPVAETKPIEEIFEETEAEAVIEGALTPKGLLELKARMLPVLQGAIAEGKIDKLRALLAAEGGGAKSFPEVDIKFFPAIEKAVQNGALK